MKVLYIVFEDALSEHVIRKMLNNLPGFTHIYPVSARGNGYIRKNLNKWNNKRNTMPYFILTDLDQNECPPSLIKEWFEYSPRKNLVFRVAVKEVEAWLLADVDGFSSFTRLSKDLIEKETRDVENITHPKEKLISLVKRSRERHLKEDIVARDGISQGPAYNFRLKEFVDDHWNMEKAKKNSRSFDKAFKALSRLSQDAA